MGLDARSLSKGICEQQKGRLACASMLSNQLLCYLLIGKYPMYATSEVSLFSVAEQAVLGMTWVETPKTGFLASPPINIKSI